MITGSYTIPQSASYVSYTTYSNNTTISYNSEYHVIHHSDSGKWSSDADPEAMFDTLQEVCRFIEMQIKVKKFL